MESLMLDALALIKKLTEELPHKEAEYNELYELTTEEIRGLLDEMSRKNESIMNLHETCTELTRKLELANLEIECKERICESYMLQYGTVADKEVWLKKERADTVRKMHSEIKDRCIKFGIYPAFVARTIEQIAEEMLEGK
jgi:DNA repair exonuclease SbcCD ATPase subunit